MLTATKARPALSRAGSSFNGKSRSQSVSMLSSSDIFSNPGRLILEEDPAVSFTPSASRRYYPSHFRLPPHQSGTHSASTSESPVLYRSQRDAQARNVAHARQARQMSTLACHRAVMDGSATMYDGPARPRHRMHIASRHEHARSASSVASMNAEDAKDRFAKLAPPEPVVYDRPARALFKLPTRGKKSVEDSDLLSSAVIGTLAGIAGLGAAYEIHDVKNQNQNQNSRKTSSDTPVLVKTYLHAERPKKATVLKMENANSRYIPSIQPNSATLHLRGGRGVKNMLNSSES